MTSFKIAAKGPGPVSGPLSWLLFICSIFFPGFTQVFYGFFFGCDCGYVFVGVLQILLFPFIIGWVWSIFWGFVACKGGADELTTETAHSPEGEPAPAPPAGEPEIAV